MLILPYRKFLEKRMSASLFGLTSFVIRRPIGIGVAAAMENEVARTDWVAD